MRTSHDRHGVPGGRDADPRAGAPPKGPATSWSPAGSIPAHFYALPQSPQLYKQILMVAGLRPLLPDRPMLPRRGPARQPPARVHPARRRDVVRRGRGRHRRRWRPLVAAMAQEFTGEELTLPLPRLDYHDAMERFGNDRPDLRFGMELKDLADLADADRVQGLPAGQGSRQPDPGHLRPGGAERVQPQGPGRPDRVRRDVRRQGAGLAQGRGRDVRRADRQVLPARGPGASSASGSTPRPAT